MSTKKTQNYQLHLWEPEDKFLRTEFNENSTKIDTAIKILSDKVGVVVGAYAGNGQVTREINLGFAPSAAILMTEGGDLIAASSNHLGGIALPGYPCNLKGQKLYELSDTGLIVYRNGAYVGSNDTSYTYHFIAFK